MIEKWTPRGGLRQSLSLRVKIAEKRMIERERVKEGTLNNG